MLLDTITVEPGEDEYEVLLGHDLGKDLINKLSQIDKLSKVAIFYQPSLIETAEAIRSAVSNAGFDAHRIELVDSEAGKDLNVVGYCYEVIGRIGISRKDALISLGGGAATDVTGFLAATWMRGVKVIHIPTTLLAMVDASIGGKTGINTAAGKNLVGVFYNPYAVIADLNMLTSLNPNEITSGLAEVIKCGFIADPKILEIVQENHKNLLDPNNSAMYELIKRSIDVKARIVSEDFKEAGLREILNYGHTLAHAIEVRERYKWRHGAAVSVGMVFVAELARLIGKIDESLCDLHRDILSSVGLPIAYDPNALNDLLGYMTIDKKASNGQLKFIILEGLAKPTSLIAPDVGLLATAYSAIGKTPSGSKTTIDL